MPDKQELLSKVIPSGSNLCFKIWTLGSLLSSQNNYVRETQIRKVVKEKYMTHLGAQKVEISYSWKKYLWCWKVVMNGSKTFDGRVMMLHRMLWWNEWRKLIWWEDEEIATGSSENSVTCFWIFINALQLRILLYLYAHRPSLLDLVKRF